MLLSRANPDKQSIRQSKIDEIVNDEIDSPSLKIIKLRAFESNQIAKDRLTEAITEYRNQKKIQKAMKGGARFKNTQEIKFRATKKVLTRRGEKVNRVQQNMNKFFFEVIPSYNRNKKTISK